MYIRPNGKRRKPRENKFAKKVKAMKRLRDQRWQDQERYGDGQLYKMK